MNGAQAVAGAQRAPVTVLGLGLMGTALAGAFLAGGYPTTVWNRTGSKTDPLVAVGASRAPTAADAVSASPLVVVCLTTAVPQMIARPEALVLYSGAQDAFQTHRRALGSLGPDAFLGADPGAASLYDLALLDGMYGMLAGFLHSVALVGTEGVAAAELTSMLVPWLNAMVGMLPGLARGIDAGEYPADDNSLEVNLAALANILQASRDQGIGTDLIAPLHAMIGKRVADGHGADSLASLIEPLKKA